MKKHLEIEWLIWAPSRWFRLVLLVWLSALIFFPLYAYSLQDKGHFSAYSRLADRLFTLSTLELLPAQVLCFSFMVMICRGFETNTYRLHLLNGETPAQIWLGKVQISVVVSLITAVLTFLITALVERSNPFSGTEIFRKSVHWTGILFIQVFAYLSFSTSFSLLFKQTFAAVGLYALWLGVLERILTHYLNENLDLQALCNLLPGRSVELLTALRMSETPAAIVSEPGFELLKIAPVLFWILLSNLINRVLFKRIALKPGHFVFWKPLNYRP